MNTEEQKEQKIIHTIINIINDYVQPKKIFLFGSRARDKNKLYSDFDIAFEGVEMNIRTERLLKDALDEKLGIFTADLINIDKVDPKFKELILKTGKIIYEG